jgi:2-amino-4-hydroxy-6-hydroxymethyldihydropteridine diphosphokinase
MPQCLISLGANLGDPLSSICTAAELLRHKLRASGGTFELSRLFRTPPVGGPAGQPPFVNAVAAVNTEQTSLQVWQAIRDVEQELGRERDRRWEARRIDLDILLYDQERIWTPHLKVPHPRMCMRRFILLPALDVAADWIDPVTRLSIRDLAAPLQSGPGSLCLVADDTLSARTCLEQVAQLASAQLVPVGQSPNSSGVRWLCLLSNAEFQRRAGDGPPPRALTPKLIVFLTEPSADRSEDWETQQLPLAAQLELLENRAADASIPGFEMPGWMGPRYLLPGGDRQWAIHELVSALEAMDCPIEPISM